MPLKVYWLSNQGNICSYVQLVLMTPYLLRLYLNNVAKFLFLFYNYCFFLICNTGCLYMCFKDSCDCFYVEEEEEKNQKCLPLNCK